MFTLKLSDEADTTTESLRCIDRSKLKEVQADGGREFKGICEQ